MGKYKKGARDEGKIAYLHYRTVNINRKSNQALSYLNLSRQRSLLNIELKENDSRH